MARQVGARARRSGAAAYKGADSTGSSHSLPSASRTRVSAGFKVPIALKLAAFIAVLLVGSMAWQASTAIRIATKHLDEEVNEAGLGQVTTLAALIRPEWLRAATPEHEQELKRFLSSYMGGSRASGERREALASGRVQDIVVFSHARGGIVATARQLAGASSQRRSREGEEVAYEPARRAGVRIREIEVEGVPVRSFLLEVRPAEPESPEAPRMLGWIEVLLSAEQILRSRDELTDSMREISVLACLSATAGAFLLASLLTRPIRALMRDMRQVSLGDLQHKSSVRSSDELGRLAQAFNAMTANLLAAQAARINQKALERELSLATSIQNKLLPAGIPEVGGMDIAAFYLAAKEVGGDYYDFIPVDDHHIGIVVADVSGKGVPGSLVMTMTRSLLRMASQGETSPAGTLHEVNQCLSPDIGPGIFVTLVYLVLDTRARELRLVRAGHNAPLFYSAQRDRLLHLKPKGIAVGLDRSGALFASQLEVQKFTLRSGDVLLLYTDGVIEGKDRSGNDFGEARLEQLLLENRSETARDIVARIARELERHQRSTERSDDITLLVLKAL